MSKSLHLIYDAIGQVGSQVASTKERAVYLWAKKNGADTTCLTAYDFANDTLPDWEPADDPDAWKKQDADTIAAHRARKQ